jgi:hypothetical protein
MLEQWLLSILWEKQRRKTAIRGQAAPDYRTGREERLQLEARQRQTIEQVGRRGCS